MTAIIFVNTSVSTSRTTGIKKVFVINHSHDEKTIKYYRPEGMAVILEKSQRFSYELLYKNNYFKSFIFRYFSFPIKPCMVPHAN